MNHQWDRRAILCVMPDDRISKQLFYSELSTRKLSHGVQRKHFSKIPSRRLWGAFDIGLSHLETRSTGLPLLAKPHLQGRSYYWGEAHSLRPRRKHALQRKERASHCHHSSSLCLSHLWQALPCPDWTFQPSPDAPKIESGCQSSFARLRWTHTPPLPACRARLDYIGSSFSVPCRTFVYWTKKKVCL